MLFSSGVARILLNGGGTGAWRTGSEVHVDKVIQKWKSSGRYFLKAKLHKNYFLDSGDFDGLTSS